MDFNRQHAKFSKVHPNLVQASILVTSTTIKYQSKEQQREQQCHLGSMDQLPAWKMRNGGNIGAGWCKKSSFLAQAV